MTDLLKKRRFRPEDISLDAVQNFYCGDEPWEREVSDWIKGQGVLDDMQRGEVWLYRTETDILVGFGSLSEPGWSYPNRNDPKPNLIPMLGIQRQFWGHPLNSLPEERYSWQIMDDIVEEAAKHKERAPVIVLYVHPDNSRAIRFYNSYGFEAFHRTYTDHVTHVVYKTMIFHI